MCLLEKAGYEAIHTLSMIPARFSSTHYLIETIPTFHCGLLRKLFLDSGNCGLSFKVLFSTFSVTGKDHMHSE